MTGRATDSATAPTQRTDRVDPKVVARVVEKHAGGRGDLISILEDIQGEYGYLPEEALRMVSVETGRPFVDVYGVATFYRSFSLRPRGRHVVSVCLGTACHVRGGPAIAEEFERRLGVKPGGTTADREFTLETVNCLGACAIGPIVVVDGHYFSNVKPVRVPEIIEQARGGFEMVAVERNEKLFPVDVNCPCCNHSLMDPTHPVDGLPSIRMVISFERRHCKFHLSALYGSFHIDSEAEIPMQAILNFFCPHCHAELVSASSCALCGAPMVPMIVQGGGMIQACARRGCRGHRLDLNGVNV